MPADLRHYFESINGFESGQLDCQLMEFYSIDRVRSVPEELGDCPEASGYPGVVRALPDAGRWFAVADYLAQSFVFAIRLEYEPTAGGRVIRISGADYMRVASSWSEFLAL